MPPPSRETFLAYQVVVELKLGPFTPEHAGKLNFYLCAVDDQLIRKGSG